jgi:lactoylglutathione lyase
MSIQVKTTKRRSFPLATLFALALFPASLSLQAPQAKAEPAKISFGYTILWVKDVEKEAAFYEKALGFAVKRRQDMGTFKWAEMATGETTLAFAGETEIKGMFPAGYSGNNPTTGPIAAQVSFVTTDVEGAYRSAVAAGASPIKTPAKMPWGQTWGQLRDPNGVLVSIASPLGQ